MTWWIRLSRKLGCETVVAGLPRHKARYLSVGICRIKWTAWLGVVLLIIGATVLVAAQAALPMESRLFRWAFPGGIILAHAVQALSLLTLMALCGERCTIRRAREAIMLTALGVVIGAGMVLGLSELDPGIVQVFTTTSFVVLLLAPLELLPLIMVLVAGVMAALSLALIAHLRLGDDRPLPFISLTPSVLAGAIAIGVNRWHARDFRVRSRSELIIIRRNREVERQKRRADQLLDSALTRPVAQQIRQTGAFAPSLDEVCVIACDIVGFSQLCERLPAQMVVEELRRFYQAFDQCCLPRGIEPLRSQGDSRLAIGGLSGDQAGEKRRPAIDAVLAMLEFRSRLAPPDRRPGGETPPHAMLWSARIGIHIGPVMMGVMEGARLSFDVWGHTVNTAARLEQGAEPNHILVSDRLLWATRGLFSYGPIRELHVKTSAVAAAALQGIREEFADRGGAPNADFWRIYRDDAASIIPPNPAGSGAGSPAVLASPWKADSAER